MLGWSTTNACSGRTGLIHHVDDFGALDDALNALAARAPRKTTVVELRSFGGLSVDETAEVLRVSPITVMREWKCAKAWLYREVAGPTANGQ
jgi:DNA-directed RNA polymerase specialized sigma24 family protein